MRNRIVGVTIALTLGLTTAACGGDDDGADSSADTSPAAATTGAAGSGGGGTVAGSQPDPSTATDPTTTGSAADEPTGPVSIDHTYGTTELEGVPERIVSLNTQWTDALLSLGVEPVGVLGDTFVDGDGRYTWQEDVLPADVMLSSTGNIPFEQIAALDPDLILGVEFVVTDENAYDLLSEIAPTVIGPLTDRDVDTWQNLTTNAGEIVGQPDEATEVIDDVEGQVAQLKADLPGLAGQTFALAQYMVGDSVYVVADPDDGSSALFQELGMELAPSVIDAAAEAPGDDARLQLSPERIGLIESDFLVFLVNGGDESNLAELPGWNNLPAVQNDAVAILDYDTIVGINTPTPLSMPHALEALRPTLEAAAA